jgi:polyisoprenoid-binding protein YceI
MVSNVKGDFKKISGKIEYDEKTPESMRIEAVIDAASIDTRDAKRDEHLRNPDFFDVAKYPTIEFRSKRIEKSGGKLAVRGDLTIHGVTREVTLDLDGPTPEIKDPRGNFRRGATATTKINRKDFGLTWNRALETGGVVVGDEVSITIEVEAMRPGK